MASSSRALASSSSPLDTRVKDLDRLMERAIEAGAAGRGALAVTLFARAEILASQLHPHDTCLIPAWLRYWRAASLIQQAALVREVGKGTPREDAGKQEVAAIRLQACELLQGVVTVLERRAAAGTMKYGTCRKEEVLFHRRWLENVQRAINAPPPSLQQLDAVSPTVGYVLKCMVATKFFFQLLNPVSFAANEQKRIEAFQLSMLDSMMDIARIIPGHSFPEEQRWVSVIEMFLALPRRLAKQHHSEFPTTLRARWTAAPFQAMLRTRGLSNARAAVKENDEQSSARRIDDVAAHGLHPCGLPSCDQREVSVKQFKYCGDCEEEWYCCAEHQVSHWKEHKPICRARAAAATAAAAALEGLSI